PGSGPLTRSPKEGLSKSEDRVDLGGYADPHDVVRRTDHAAVDAGRARGEAVERREFELAAEIEMLIFGADDEVGPAAFVHHVLDSEPRVPAIVPCAGVVERDLSGQTAGCRVDQPSLDVGDGPAAAAEDQPVAPSPT